VVDRRDVTVARVPHLTPRGTFVLNGVDYTLSNQMRLLPGVFTRRKESGELESHVNVMPGKGVSHRLNLDPETGVFRIELGQARMPLLPLLRTLGAADADLRTAWGDDIYSANLRHDDASVNEKLFRRLVRLKPGEAVPDRRARLRAEFEAMGLDPEVTARTLREPHQNVSAASVLAATRRLLAVNRGEEEVDDRDHAAFQQFLGQEDLFAERLKLAVKVLRPLVYRAGAKGSLDPVQSGALSKLIESTITQTGLGQPLEEVGPADVLDQLTRVTRMGVGLEPLLLGKPLSGQD
jgi:DNA-directed RNA polymerase beta subunit